MSTAIHLVIDDGVLDDAVIWIDETSFVARKPDHVEEFWITYDPPSRDRERSQALAERYGGLDRQLETRFEFETRFEWFARVGTNTLNGTGDDSFSVIHYPNSPKESRSVKLSLGKGVGWIVGRIVHRLGTSHKRDRDPIFQHRWLVAERSQPALARAIPAISNDGPYLDLESGNDRLSQDLTPYAKPAPGQRSTRKVAGASSAS